jgi:cytochrome c oxidase assembly protein subunit 15
MNPATAILSDPYHRGSDLLAIGFGTTVAMWAVGYVCRFPGVEAPGWLLLALLMLCLVAGGWAAGRLTTRGVVGGLQVGLLAGALNLLILGSLLASTESPNRLVPSAVWWVPGSLLLAAALAVLGSLLGRRPADGDAPLQRHGLPSFATVAAAATFLLVIAGGIVTGHEAGLAVTDWPNSYRYNMFLYPLSRMTGGIYYEHVHRLFGSLVGLTTLVLAVHLWRVEARRWLCWLGTAALVLVIGQGILGGLRVTGHFTLTDDPSLVRPNIWLAVVHGVTGQLFFGLMVAIAAFSSRGWREARASAVASPGDRRLAIWLLATVAGQLTLGALLRHTDAALHAHITLAVLVVSLGIALGSRLALKHRDQPVLRRLGHGLMHGLAIQFLLGFGALFARNLSTDGSPHLADVAVTTVHQAVGALVLALAVLSVLWTRRLLTGQGEPPTPA